MTVPQWGVYGYKMEEPNIGHLVAARVPAPPTQKERKGLGNPACLC